MPSAGSPGPLWEPSDEQRASAEMTRFMAWAAQRSGRALADYEALRRWSVEQLEEFWAAIWDYAGVRASRPYERVLDSHRMPGTRWFEGAQLNYAKHIFRDASERSDAFDFGVHHARVSQDRAGDHAIGIANQDHSSFAGPF